MSSPDEVHRTMLDNQEVVIQAKGDHSRQPRMVRGTSARRRQAARDMASAASRSEPPGGERRWRCAAAADHQIG